MNSLVLLDIIFRDVNGTQHKFCLIKLSYFFMNYSNCSNGFSRVIVNVSMRCTNVIQIIWMTNLVFQWYGICHPKHHIMDSWVIATAMVSRDLFDLF